MSNSTPDKTEQIESLLRLEIEDLYIEFGNALARKSMGMSGTNPERSKLLGKNWFNAQKNKIRSIVCKNNRIQFLLKQGSASDSIELTSLVADIIASQYVGIPVFTLSALIIKTGLGYLCEEDE